MNKRPITPEDLYAYRWVTDPVVSIQGRAAYVQQTIDREKNEYQTHIRTILLDGSEDTAVTAGMKDSSPSWSPDGSMLSFLRLEEGGKGLWVIPVDADSMEPKRLVAPERKILQYAWSPAGTHIAFTSKVRQDSAVVDAESSKTAPLRGKVYERTTPKAEGSGWWDGLYSHLFVYDIENDAITQLTAGSWNVSSPIWSPDGTEISFVSKQVEDASLDADLLYFADVYTIRPGEREPRKVTDSSLLISQFAYTPNGESLMLLASDREFGSGSHNRLYEVPSAGGQPTPVAPGLDMQLGNAALGDMKSAGASPSPQMAAGDGGASMYVLGTHDGTVDVYRIGADGTAEAVTFGGERDVYQYAVSSDGQTLLFAALTDERPGELYALNLKSGQETRLTHHNDELMDQLQVNKPERIEFVSSDGWRIQGWLLLPEQREAGAKVPLILQIHGGPHAMYTGVFSHEMQTLVAQGYAVLMVNPRGSMGYGQQFAKACRGDFAGGDCNDLLEAVDVALAQYDVLDDTRLGVAGGSYGGVMTNWIVAHTNRFKAAVTQRSISNWLSMYGTSDIGISYVEGVIGGNPTEHADMLWSRSPLAHAHNIETPLLIMHGEQDYRTPVSQAEELYTTLKRQGKVTKLIRYPGSNHSLLKSGKPSLRVDSFEQVNAWFSQYL